MDSVEATGVQLVAGGEKILRHFQAKHLQRNNLKELGVFPFVPLVLVDLWMSAGGGDYFHVA